MNLDQLQILILMKILKNCVKHKIFLMKNQKQINKNQNINIIKQIIMIKYILNVNNGITKN